MSFVLLPPSLYLLFQSANANSSLVLVEFSESFRFHKSRNGTADTLQATGSDRGAVCEKVTEERGLQLSIGKE